MTGAGSGELILGHEDGFATGTIATDGSGDDILFGAGRNDTLTELDLQNQLENLSQGDEAWDVESIKTNFEGAVGVEAAISGDVHDRVEEIVFNDGGSIAPGTTDSAASAPITPGVVFTDVDFATGTADRKLMGCIPIDYSIDYSQGEMTTYSLTMAYADEEPNPTVDLTTATRASAGSTVPFHGTELQIDGTVVEDLQSASLSLSEIARLQYGASPTANRGVIASPSATLDVEAIFTSPSRLELARGAASSAPPDTISSVSGTLTLTSAGGTTVSTYSLQNIKPDNYTWNEVLSDEDTTDSTTFNVTGDDAVSVA